MEHLREEQVTSDLEQSISEVDQSAAEVDQTLSESDQASSDRDRNASDRDQKASDIDQEADDDGTRGEATRHDMTRRMRAEGTQDRGATTEAREQTALTRDRVADQRDTISAARDVASNARDQLAGALDAEIERLEAEQIRGQAPFAAGSNLRLRVAHARRLAAQTRAGAAAQREAAGEERAQAAADREAASLDRQAYRQELAKAEIDEVTGALRRGPGLSAMQREMDRTARSNELLIVVFIDVDGLKLVNDTSGHAAGDALLRAVVSSVLEEFRSYDLIVRYGGDEFLCVLSGRGLESIGARFRRIGTRIDASVPGAAITIGVTRRRPGDTAKSLIDRADAAMIAERRKCRRGRQPSTLPTGLTLNGPAIHSIGE